MSLGSKIECAWASLACPREGEILEGDGEGALETFRGRSWHDLQSNDLDYHSSVLPILSPTAFAYYIPAFMLAALDNEHLGVSDAVISCLCPPRNDPSRLSFARRWTVLTPTQRSLVIAFLRHFSYRNPIVIQAAASALESANNA